MVARGVSVRQAATQLGVTEGALRFRLKRFASGAPDGRRERPSALAGFETAVGAVLEALAATTRRGRPIQGRLVYEALVRDHGYAGSYPALIRYLRRVRGVPVVRALRRVETPPGVQAQHDWFEQPLELAGEGVTLYGLLGTLAHSRASFVWVSRRMTQVAWQAGHAALFQRYGGVPRWIRIDNLRTAVVAGAGPTAQLSPAFQTFARACGFQIDPCRAATASDKGKVERRVRALRDAVGALFARPWDSLEALQTALDGRMLELHQRLRCPVTGTSVAAALTAERAALLSLPVLGEPFDLIAARRVSRDCLVSFEGRQYSVPFAWVGREVEILGTARAVVIRAAGRELARHPRHTAARLVLEPAHYEGPQINHVVPPTPLGRRARWQLAGALPAPAAVARPLAAYVTLVEEACR
jgi:transposase